MESNEALDASPFCDQSIDLNTQTSSTLQQQRLAFAHQFTHRLKHHGYVRLQNHGISASQIALAFQAHKTFFDLPLPRKRELLYRGGATPARGFTPSHTEKTFLHLPHLSQAAPDAGEPREQLTLGPPEDRAFPTPWFAPSAGDGDEDLASCHAALRALYDACRAVALNLVRALELGLGLRADALTGHYRPDASELTLNWYPAVRREELLGPRMKRIWPHSDLGIVSLLFQDGVGGLEFEDRGEKGGFVPVRSAGRVEMLVNAADTLERWTNGVLPAGVHRVAAPEVDGGGGGELGGGGDVVPERRSIVLLYRSKGEASVAPLADFVTPDRPARFEEMTATEYLKVKNKLTFGNGEE